MSGLQWLCLSWLDNVVIVVNILAWLYPPILITERNVPNYELSKMRWNGKRIKRWASSLHLSSSPLNKTLEKEKKSRKVSFSCIDIKSNQIPNHLYILLFADLFWLKRSHQWWNIILHPVMHLFWVWGHDDEGGRWKLDVVTTKKRSSSILCQMNCPWDNAGFPICSWKAGRW